jgi:glycosyltransferase involved in cell wall biosynthesis
VAQNEVQRSSCRATYGREAVVIPSLYQIAAKRERNPVRKDSVLWVGTLRAGKRPELLLELAARLPQRRFVMVGGPSGGETALYERIRDQAARLANVEFTGFLPLARVEPWFDRAKVFVNTSTYEGMPNTFLQAWARGVPTLATVDVGAPVNRVFQGVDEGARAIDSFFDSPAVWEDASDRCRRHFERTHSSAEVLTRYGRLFDELAA